MRGESSPNSLFGLIGLDKRANDNYQSGRFGGFHLILGTPKSTSNVGIGLGGRVPIIWAVWDTVLQELQQLENLLGTLYKKSLHFILHLIFHIAD